ncbi:drug resistance transporter, EmrB/QacA subfamily [Nocardioides terrae]|uniref:Drug resistance transporter, EmrB/QacA subfamily n=1 Tax=Nocardioides terrae TaxID=574651 RepID=A0A1I1NSU8_9ACTN|nr:MFS transporter [Nocardioides terrae]SFD00751.1 drug resistance transporter, EmrB/QacA subfamily [Nocardioides terrae]
MTVTAPPPAHADPATASLPTSRTRAERRRTIALGLLVSAQFVVMLDTSIVNVALPSIRADLALSPSGLSWVVNAYVLAFGGLLLLPGRVADLLGRRRMFVGGAAVFTIGTLLAASAASAWMLIAGRIVQGVGAAALSPAAMSLLLLNFSGDRRARAMSLWGAASAVGGATGVFAGGILTGTFGWSSVFLVTVPASVTAVVLGLRVLEDSPRTARRTFDAAGALTITGAIVALVHGALRAADGGLTAPTVLAFVVAAVLLAAFVLLQRRATDPLVPLELFRSRVLRLGVALAILGGAARASTFVLVALYLQQALALSPEHAGLAMVPTSVGGFAVSLTLLPKVLRAIGPRRSLVGGLLVLAAGQLWLAWGPGSLGYPVAVLPGLLLVATGVALSFTPTTMVLASAVPDSHAGLASGLASSATQVGAALGTATFTAIALSSGRGFPAAFTAAAAVALGTAILGGAIARR